MRTSRGSGTNYTQTAGAAASDAAGQLVDDLNAGTPSGSGSSVATANAGAQLNDTASASISVPSTGSVAMGAPQVLDWKYGKDPVSSPAASTSSVATASTPPSVGTGSNWLGQAASTILDLIPGVGTIKSVIEFFTGRDLVTGTQVSRLSSAFSVATSAVRGVAILKAVKNGLHRPHS